MKKIFNIIWKLIKNLGYFLLVMTARFLIYDQLPQSFIKAGYYIRRLAELIR